VDDAHPSGGIYLLLPFLPASLCTGTSNLVDACPELPDLTTMDLAKKVPEDKEEAKLAASISIFSRMLPTDPMDVRSACSRPQAPRRGRGDDERRYRSSTRNL